MSNITNMGANMRPRTGPVSSYKPFPKMIFLQNASQYVTKGSCRSKGIQNYEIN